MIVATGDSSSCVTSLQNFSAKLFHFSWPSWHYPHTANSAPTPICPNLDHLWERGHFKQEMNVSAGKIIYISLGLFISHLQYPCKPLSHSHHLVKHHLLSSVFKGREVLRFESGAKNTIDLKWLRSEWKILSGQRKVANTMWGEWGDGWLSYVPALQIFKSSISFKSLQVFILLDFSFQ